MLKAKINATNRQREGGREGETDRQRLSERQPQTNPKSRAKLENGLGRRLLAVVVAVA